MMVILSSVIGDIASTIGETIEDILLYAALIIGGIGYGIYKFFRNRRRTKQNPDWEIEEKIEEDLEDINRVMGILESEDIANMSRSPKEYFADISREARGLKTKLMKLKNEEHRSSYQESLKELMDQTESLKQRYTSEGLFEQYDSPKVQRSRKIEEMNDALASLESDIGRYLSAETAELKNIYRPDFSRAENVLATLKSMSEPNDAEIQTYERRLKALREKAEGRHVAPNGSAATNRTTSKKQNTSTDREENKRRQRILSENGVDVKVDGSWGPWQQKQWDALQQRLKQK